MALWFGDSRNYRYPKSVVTWRNIHKHIVADQFRSKISSSALLVHEHIENSTGSAKNDI